MLEDRRFIWQLKAGREEALVRKYGKYKSYLLKIAYGLLNDAAVAEDVVQDVCLALAESTSRLRVEGHLRGYLVRSLVNRVHNLRRRKHNRSLALSEIEEPGAEDQRPDLWAVRDESMQNAHRALAQLPEKQRIVIVLHVHAGLKFQEIADMEQLSINTVQSRYRYGLEKLRIVLNGEIDA